MSISKVSTLTSGILAITDISMIDNKETIEFKRVHSRPEQINNILVIDKNSDNLSNYDEQISKILKMGFKIIISDSFANTFSAKAINLGILTIDVSRIFLDHIFEAYTNSSIKLFIDLKGQEIMIIHTGEKEYFELSDYNRESLENGEDDFENLYAVWDGLDYSYKHEEIFDFAIE